jgi:hypothetical protein
MKGANADMRHIHNRTSNSSSMLLLALGSLAAVALALMFAREVPAMRRELRIARM